MLSSIMSGSFNVFSIGRVGEYSQNLVKSYLSAAETGAAGTKDDSAATVTSNVVKNTTAFATKNVTNLKHLKSAATALNNTARGLGANASAEDVVSAAQNFASAYNNTITHLTSGQADGAGVEKALNLVTNNRLTALSAASYGSYAANRLSSMGITIDEDGMMQVDAEKLTAAVENSPASVKASLSGYGSLSELTERNADKAIRIPKSTYTDFSQMRISNSLIDALLPNAGFLFDFNV